MTAAPACTRLGRHCRALTVTLRIGDTREDDGPTRDAVATWLLGHRERISFGEPYQRGPYQVVDAEIQVACKYLVESVADGTRREGAVGGPDACHKVQCAAHGFVGRLPATGGPTHPLPLHREDGTLTVVHRGRSRPMPLRHRPAPLRALPVLNGNPCAGAPCRTADHVRGAACCRDLTLEILAPADERRSDRLEALLLARRSPYLCKTERVSADILECEVISACSYLEMDGITCALHERLRPDGRPAKPSVCTAWPDWAPDSVTHPGCRLAERNKRGAA